MRLTEEQFNILEMLANYEQHRDLHDAIFRGSATSRCSAISSRPRYQKAQTELVVMITPQIVRRGSTGVSQGLPTAVEPYLAPVAKPLPQPVALRRLAPLSGDRPNQPAGLAAP